MAVLRALAAERGRPGEQELLEPRGRAARRARAMDRLVAEAGEARRSLLAEHGIFPDSSAIIREFRDSR